MANTGYKQAIIAYKVSKPEGEPLDINGQPTRISGNKQAIALLIGYSNPDPSKYEVEQYYAKGAVLTGNPTVVYDMLSCPVGYIRLSVNRLILNEPAVSDTFTLESSGGWRLVSGPTEYINLDFTSGTPGIYVIRATGIALGDGNFIFENTDTLQTASIYIANIAGRPWILETAYWNNLGIWYSDGVWNY